MRAQADRTPAAHDDDPPGQRRAARWTPADAPLAIALVLEGDRSASYRS